MHRQRVVINMSGGAATVADQKNAVVQASWVRIGDIGICAFDPAGKVRRHKQVQYAVDAVGRNAFPAPL